MDETVLMDQALAGATHVLSQHVPASTLAMLDTRWLQGLLAIAWLEGRQAGGQEAQAVLARLAEGYR